MRKTGLRPAWQREQSDTRGWLLYDGACGFCAHWVMRFEWALRRRGIATVPLQEEWVRDFVPLSEAELMKDITLVLAEGGVLRGADAYRWLLRQYWWTYPLAVLASAPFARRLFDACYRWFAGHRHALTGSCLITRRQQAARG